MSLPSTANSLPSVNEIAESSSSTLSMMDASTGSSLSGTSLGLGVGVGVGMASYSSSHTPFSTTPSIATSTTPNQMPAQLILSNSTYRSPPNVNNYIHTAASSSNTSSNPNNNINFNSNTNGANFTLQSNHNYNAALAAATSQLSQNCNFLNVSPSSSNFLPSLAGIRSHHTIQTSSFPPSPSPSSAATTNNFLINNFQATNSASPETLVSNANGLVNSHLNSIIHSNGNGSRHILNAGVAQTSPSATIATGAQQLTLTLITTIPTASITTTTSTNTTPASITEIGPNSATSSNSTLQITSSTSAIQSIPPLSSSTGGATVPPPVMHSATSNLISTNSNLTSNSNFLTLNGGHTLIQQQPSTSAVSSSSAPITPAQNLSSTTRDWFTYVYKIDNIEELIKNVDSSTSSSGSTQQNFIQSPVFSFTNHIVNVAPSSINSTTAAASTAITNPTSNNVINSSGLNGSSSAHSFSSSPASTVPMSSQTILGQSNGHNSTLSQTTHFQNNNGGGNSASLAHQQQLNHHLSSNIPGSNQQSSSINFNNTAINNSQNISNESQSPSVASVNNTSNNTINTNNSSTNVSSGSSIKQPSNWRLIFYPNGAGGDCKNFLSIFLKYLSDEPVKIQMMFSIVDNNNEDVYVKYTVNKFNKSNDWGFKQLIHKNAILFQKEKFLKSISTNGNGSSGGSLSVRVKMRLDDQKHDYIKKLNDNLHYCKLLSENFSQYYYNNNNNNSNNIANVLCSNLGAGTSSSVNNLVSHKNEINGESTNNNISNSKTVSLSSAITNTNLNAQFNQHNAQTIVSQTPSVTISPSSSFTPSSSVTPTSSFSGPTSLSSSFNGSSSLFDPSFGNLNSSLNTRNSPGSSSTLALSNSLLNSNSTYFDILLLVRLPNLNESYNNETSFLECNTISSNTSILTSAEPNNLMCNNCFNIQNLEKVQNMYMRTLDSVSKSNRRNYSTLLTPSALEELDSDYYCSTPNKKLKLSNGSHLNASIINQETTKIMPAKNLKSCQKCGNSITSCPSLLSPTASQQNLDKPEFIEFRAHKCILAARSPVFKAMFNYRLKENLTNKLIIEDCKPEVVQALLKYIYTAYLPDDIRTIAIDLYIAAEKYFIESLKIKCREYLVENLNSDSCIQVYILSEFYNDSMLRKQSLKFISENIDKVTQNSDWNEFMLAYPQFFTNAFIRLCKKDF